MKFITLVFLWSPLCQSAPIAQDSVADPEWSSVELIEDTASSDKILDKSNVERKSENTISGNAKGSSEPKYSEGLNIWLILLILFIVMIPLFVSLYYRLRRRQKEKALERQNSLEILKGESLSVQQNHDTENPAISNSSPNLIDPVPTLLRHFPKSFDEHAINGELIATPKAAVKKKVNFNI